MKKRVHEHIKVPLLLGRRKMEILLVAFARFCSFSKEFFSRKSPISNGGQGRLKPGKLTNLKLHIGNITRRFLIFLL